MNIDYWLKQIFIDWLIELFYKNFVLHFLNIFMIWDMNQLKHESL